MFDNDPPLEYNSNSLQPIDGITLNVGNTTEEIQASVCAISDYLNVHLKAIVNSLTQHQNHIIRNISMFHSVLEGVVNPLLDGPKNTTSIPKCSPRKLPTLYDYEKKETGLKIIYFTKKWVKSFIHTKCSFN